VSGSAQEVDAGIHQYKAGTAIPAAKNGLGSDPGKITKDIGIIGKSLNIPLNIPMKSYLESIGIHWNPGFFPNEDGNRFALEVSPIIT
jgi:hypothetical protein